MYRYVTAQKTQFYGSAGAAILADAKRIFSACEDHVNQYPVSDFESMRFDYVSAPSNIKKRDTIELSSGKTVDVYSGVVSATVFGVDDSTDSWYELGDVDVFGKCVDTGDSYMPLCDYTFAGSVNEEHIEKSVNEVLNGLD